MRSAYIHLCAYASVIVCLYHANERWELAALLPAVYLSHHVACSSCHAPALFMSEELRCKNIMMRKYNGITKVFDKMLIRSELSEYLVQIVELTL